MLLPTRIGTRGSGGGAGIALSPWSYRASLRLGEASPARPSFYMIGLRSSFVVPRRANTI